MPTWKADNVNICYLERGCIVRLDNTLHFVGYRIGEGGRISSEIKEWKKEKFDGYYGPSISGFSKNRKYIIFRYDINLNLDAEYVLKSAIKLWNIKEVEFIKL